MPINQYQYKDLSFRVYDSLAPPLHPSPSPFVTSTWNTLFSGYPSKLRDNIIGILNFGALIGYEAQPQLLVSKNLFSAFENPQITTTKLNEDLALRRVVRATPIMPFISSPLDLVAKHDGGWRRIHYLSFPDNHSVNNCIPKTHSSIEYITIDAVFKLITNAGKECLIIKRDIKDAFRNIPVSPTNQWLLGFEWKGQHYAETCLPFGLTTAPALFNLFADAFEWLLRTCLHWRDTVHYLDDFIRIVPNDQKHSLPSACQDYIELTEALGIPRNDSKDCCGRVVEVLGIEIDTHRFMARLSPRKLEKAVTLVSALVEKHTSRGQRYRLLQ